jgi:hypothetical protein
MASHRISDRQRARIEAEDQRAYERKHAAAKRKAVNAARKVVAIWNERRKAGVELWFYPTIGAAITAGCPLLSFYCPACGQVTEVDLRKIDRHHGATIESLIPALSCKRCRPNAPFAKLMELAGRRGSLS